MATMAGQWDRIADGAFASAAVPALVMAERDLFGKPQEAEVAAREDARRSSCGFSPRELFVRELSQLQQHRVRDTDLPDVVERAARRIRAT